MSGLLVVLMMLIAAKRLGLNRTTLIARMKKTWD